MVATCTGVFGADGQTRSVGQGSGEAGIDPLVNQIR